MHAAPPNAAFSRPLLAGLILTLAIIAAYLTSFRGTWVFDDLNAIVENPTIRDLHRIDQVLLAPVEGGTIAGRPVVNLTLALNHAIGGLAPGGYHAVNLLIHVLAALTLFGFVRRTLVIVGRGLRTPPDSAVATRSRRDTVIPPYNFSLLAFTIAALWALHPLQTAAVTYIVQRAESLCGLFFLLTLYCFVRSVDHPTGGVTHPHSSSPHQSGYKTPPTSEKPQPRTWMILSVLACLTGMATKEVMAAAPLLVLLYDRTFVAGSWREAWRQRVRFHVALMSTWLLLAWLVLSAENRGGTAGFGTAVAWWQYALTQCPALLHYLRLSLWPYPLVFDYGTPLYPSLSSVALPAAMLLALLGLTGWALKKKPAQGFLGAWFFLILAPSSSVVPVATQTMAEHRMYLPLAAVITLVVLGAHVLAGRRAMMVLLGLAVATGGLTARRNLVYHSELALWSDTVAHRPDNPRAHTNLGIALVEADRLPEAVAAFEASLRLQPDNAATHLNLCDILTRLDRAAEALPHGEAAVRLEPASAGARVNLGRALVQLGRPADAILHYEEAWRLQPAATDVPRLLIPALYAEGNGMASRGDFAGAIARYRRILELNPDHGPGRNNLANALLVSGHTDEAITHYRELLRRNPGDRRVQENLSRALELPPARRP